MSPPDVPEGSLWTGPRIGFLCASNFGKNTWNWPIASACSRRNSFWDHLATKPGAPTALASTCILRGRAGDPKGPGWSRTVHYEVTSMARVNYQFNDNYRNGPDDDKHRVVAILTIDYSSH